MIGNPKGVASTSRDYGSIPGIILPHRPPVKSLPWLINTEMDAKMCYRPVSDLLAEKISRIQEIQIHFEGMVVPYQAKEAKMCLGTNVPVSDGVDL